MNSSTASARERASLANCRPSASPIAQLDAARLGELERVREQVLDHLLQPLLVGLDRGWHVRAAHLDLEAQLLVFRDRAERALDEVAQVGQLDVSDVDVHASRLDLREVEDVVDQLEQVGAGAVDRLGELDLLAR